MVAAESALLCRRTTSGGIPEQLAPESWLCSLAWSGSPGIAGICMHMDSLELASSALHDISQICLMARRQMSWIVRRQARSCTCRVSPVGTLQTRRRWKTTASCPRMEDKKNRRAMRRKSRSRLLPAADELCLDTLSHRQPVVVWY